jgi:cell division protein FtsB
MTLVNKHTWRTIASALGACIVGYFVYHTIQGDRGWLAMVRLQQQVNLSQDNLSQLQNDRRQLEHRVQLMRPDSLDPDLLDEKSRELLNYSKPGEVVILTPPQNKPVIDDILSQRSK